MEDCGEVNPMKKKILLIGPTPPPYAGVEIMTACIAGSPLLRERYHFSFYNTRKPIRNEEKGRFAMKNIFFNLSLLLGLLIRMVKFRPYLIHMPLAQNKLGFFRDSLYVMLAKAIKAKVVLHFHGGNFTDFYRGEPAIYRRYIKGVLSLSSLIIVLGETLKGQFQGIIPEKVRIRSLYNCVEMDGWDRIPRGGRESVQILFVGKISAAKGALDLLLAAERLLKIRTDIQFHFVGDVVDRTHNVTNVQGAGRRITDTIERISRDPMLAGRVHFLGTLVGEKKMQEYREADIFAFPSLAEGLPLVILEAMAAGLPIITTRVGSLPEFLVDGENCLYVRPRDVDDIVEKLMILVENKGLREKMGEENHTKAKQLFQKEVFVKNLIGIYEEL
jgi:glycosyltransferase involved in cell wall biosynthesis